MKKLMIIAGVMMLALASQAAQFSWQLSASKSTVTSLGLDGASVYMVLAADYDSSKQYSLADIQSVAKSQGTLTVGQMGAGTGPVTVNDSWVVENTTYSWYAVVINDDQYYVSSAATTSTAVSDTATPQNTTFSSKTEMATASNWQTLAIPEPTSGLLMLVGLGALALRRKRA